ncbi:MAG: hypothetical protein J0M08_08630 [Bacteroidetes bacterium]|nr:hypothetical protein [Bacteroidota bacterium]
MDTIIVLFSLIILASVILIGVYFILKQFFDQEEKKRNFEIKKTTAEQLVPLKLQAYERMILLLERISPNSLVMRVNKSGVSVRFFQGELIKNIRGEFEHNLSQQIYISPAAWEMVKSAKEEIIKLVNLASTQVKETSDPQELAQKIIELSAQLKKLPTAVAIDFIKKEVSQSL